MYYLFVIGMFSLLCYRYVLSSLLSVWSLLPVIGMFSTSCYRYILSSLLSVCSLISVIDMLSPPCYRYVLSFPVIGMFSPPSYQYVLLFSADKNTKTGDLAVKVTLLLFFTYNFVHPLFHL